MQFNRKNAWCSLKKLTYNPAITLFTIYSREMKIYVNTKPAHECFCSFIGNSPKLEASQMSFNGWNKLSYIHTVEQSSAVKGKTYWYPWLGWISRNFTEWNRHSEKVVYYMISFIKQFWIKILVPENRSVVNRGRVEEGVLLQNYTRMAWRCFFAMMDQVHILIKWWLHKSTRVIKFLVYTPEWVFIWKLVKSKLGL